MESRPGWLRGGRGDTLRGGAGGTAGVDLWVAGPGWPAARELWAPEPEWPPAKGVRGFALSASPKVCLLGVRMVKFIYITVFNSITGQQSTHILNLIKSTALGFWGILDHTHMEHMQKLASRLSDDRVLCHRPLVIPDSRLASPPARCAIVSRVATTHQESVVSRMSMCTCGLADWG